eukprot:349801-Chlamydomonas_euryale.AAC.26
MSVFFACCDAHPGVRGICTANISNIWMSKYFCKILNHMRCVGYIGLLHTSMHELPTFILQPRMSAGRVPDELALHASTEDVPGVWASADHNCIMWCNQLVVRLASLLLQVAEDVHQDTDPSSRSALVLRHARTMLTGGIHERLMFARGPHEQTKHIDLGTRLSETPDTECGGANLVWYLQYNIPVAVSKPIWTLSYAMLPKNGLGMTGRLYHWELQQGATDFTLFLSGAQPCEGFRVWLHNDLPLAESVSRAASAARLQQLAEHATTGAQEGSADAQRMGDGSTGDHRVDLRNHVDVTALATALPPLHAAARQAVRIWNESGVVMRGKDYKSANGWILRLPPNLLINASRITVWFGKLSIKKAFRATVHLRTAGQEVVALSKPQFISKASANGHWQTATLIDVEPQWYLKAAGFSWKMLGLCVLQRTPVGTQRHHCLHPAVIIAQTRSSDYIRANMTVFSLQACASNSPTTASCRVLLILDRQCDYHVSVRPDPAAQLPELLLQNVHAIWAATQAIALCSLAAVLSSNPQQRLTSQDALAGTACAGFSFLCVGALVLWLHDEFNFLSTFLTGLERVFGAMTISSSMPRVLLEAFTSLRTTATWNTLTMLPLIIPVGRFGLWLHVLAETAAATAAFGLVVFLGGRFALTGRMHASPTELGLDGAFVTWSSALTVSLAILLTTKALTYCTACLQSFACLVTRKLPMQACTSFTSSQHPSRLILLVGTTFGVAAFLHMYLAALMAVIALLGMCFHTPGKQLLTEAHLWLILFGTGAAMSGLSTASFLQVQLHRCTSGYGPHRKATNVLASFLADNLKYSIETLSKEAVHNIFCTWMPAVACFAIVRNSFITDDNKHTHQPLVAACLRVTARVAIACAFANLDWAPTYTQATASVLACMYVFNSKLNP